MPFKAGRLFEVLLNSIDASVFLNSAEWAAKVEAAPTDVAKLTWHTFIPDLLSSSLTTEGYYDPTESARRSTVQVIPSTTTGIVTYAPAGATAVGDQCRLIQINTTDYKESPKVGGAVPISWSVDSTAPVGIGVSLHPLAQEATGTITGTGDGVYTSAAGTGFIAHLHVTQVSSAASSSFKLQDATTQGGAYTDIAGGAFTNMTAVGAQRLVVLGTVRQFVRCLAVIGPATTTYSISVARYPT